MTNAPKHKVGEHDMRDDAFRPGGRAWQHGIRFVCVVCGLERRKVEEGQDKFFLRGKRVKGTEPCLR